MKLIRDRIPEIARENGQDLTIQVADYKIMPYLLRAKLREEVAEYLESGELEELVDILEVVRALGQYAHGVFPPTLERVRGKKAIERGIFNEKFILIEESNGE